MWKDAPENPVSSLGVRMAAVGGVTANECRRTRRSQGDVMRQYHNNLM